MAKTEDIGKALVEALAEDLPLIRNIFSAGKKVLDRFKSRLAIVKQQDLALLSCQKYMMPWVRLKTSRCKCPNSTQPQ